MNDTAARTLYASKTDAIERNIIDPIEATGIVTDARAEYDIDAIADELLAWDDGGDELYPLNHQGFRVVGEPTDFWRIVEKHSR